MPSMDTLTSWINGNNRHWTKRLFSIIILIIFISLQQNVTARVLDVNEQLTDLVDKHPDKSWLVKFYAPWCHYCQQLEPTYINVAERIYHKYDHLIVARVDCTKSGQMCNNYGVDSYPTIIFLNKETRVKYRGERSEKSLLDFADRLTRPSINKIDNCEQLKAATDQHGLVFLSSIKNNSNLLQKEFESIAESHRFEYWFYQITKSCISPKIDQGLYLLKKHLERPIQFQYPDNVDNDWLVKNLAQTVLNWARNESLPVYGRIQHEKIHHILNLNKTVILAALDEYKPSRNFMPSSQKFHNRISQFARRYAQTNENLLFGWTSDLDLIEFITITRISLPNLIFLKPDLQFYILFDEDRKADMPGDQIESSIESTVAAIIANQITLQGGNSYSHALQRLVLNSFNKFMRTYRASPLLVSVIFGFPGILIVFVIYTTCCHDGFSSEEDEDREDDQYQDEVEPLLRNGHVKQD